MSETRVLENAKIVTPDEVLDGWIGLSDGRIAEIGTGRPPERGADMAGDYLLPGLVELHTDHLESHLSPRPKVRWNHLSAALAYDAQIAASGITTVFDSLRVGSDVDGRSATGEFGAIAEAIESARASNLLRVDHRTHLRCEICASDVIEEATHILGQFRVNLISLMDHTPGARQFRDTSTWKIYYGGKSGSTDEHLETIIRDRVALHQANHDRHRGELVALAKSRGIVLASHDDTTLAHVAESAADGIRLAEFPTTVEAAVASHAAGIQVMMGAPNVVRGGSHSGNVSAETLARAGVLDILSSDYVPASLLMGAFEIANRIEGFGLNRAVNTVSLNPSLATGLDDRGALRAGLKADLIRVHMAGRLPVVREVWRDAQRVI